MKRRIAVVLLIAILAVSFTVPAAYAQYKGKQYRPSGERARRYENLEEKFIYKAYFMLKNREELGLSDGQVSQIKKLKTGVKKDLINKQAKIDLLAVDIKTEMWEDPLNIDVINSLIEQKYEVKKEKAKSLVAAIVKLKGILTEEQKKKLTDLYRKKD